ncbi:MAG: hypothetical protein KBT36_09320 [Kurthia sp.]|nr:hypothetical protein [Candidatus Kurthia equi]
MYPIRKWIIKLDSIGFVSSLEMTGMTQAYDLIYEHEVDKGIAKVIRTYSKNDEKEIKRIAKLLKGTLIEV